MTRGAGDQAPPPGPVETPHYKGHRERLRSRFLETGDQGLPDYEILELLLFRSIPQRDVKPLAKELIARFGSLSGVLGARRERLTEVIDRVGSVEGRFGEVTEGMQSQVQGAEQIRQSMDALAQNAARAREATGEFAQASANLQEHGSGMA